MLARNLALLLLLLGLLVHADIDISVKKKKKTKKGHVARDEGSGSGSGSIGGGYGEQIQAFQNQEYRGTVSVGTPPQTFEVIMDTGSDVFWLPEVGCTSSGPDVSACRSGQGLYNPAASTTAVDLNTRFQITYGTGSATGDYYSDVMSFGDANAEHVEVGNVTLGAASRMTFSDEGILGLSFAQSGDPTPIFQLAVQRGVFSQPVFSVYLADCDGDCDNGGLIKFGGVDTQHCDAVVGTANVVGQTPYWLFDLDGISVGGQSIPSSGTSMKAIVDTGTSIIAGPMSVIRRVASELGAESIQGVYVVPCNAQLQLDFTINGQQYTVTSAELILAGAIATDTSGQNYCQLAIDGDNQLNFVILGSPFIRAYCLIHNVQDRTIGFAPVKTKNTNGSGNSGTSTTTGGGRGHGSSGGGRGGSSGGRGGGNSPFGTGDNWPFGNSGDPFGSSDPFGGDSWPFGNSGNPFGNSDPFGGDDGWPFGNRGNPFGGGPRNSPFGSGSWNSNPFAGGGQSSWGFPGRGGDPFFGSGGSWVHQSPWSTYGSPQSAAGGFGPWLYDRPYKK